MKLNPTILATGISSLFMFSLAIPAAADVKEAARAVHENSNDKIVGIKGLLKIDVTMNGQPAQNQESPVWGNGTMIGEGLAVTGYSTLVPDVSAQAPGGTLPPGIEIKTDLNEVKFVDSSGEEYDAKLILHDEDLDLAFLAIDPKSDNADAWEIGAVDISSDPEAGLLDDVITLSRHSATLRFASAVKTGTVNAVIKRPRVMYAVDGIKPGAPAFTTDGAFLGMVVLRKSADNKQQAVPVVLPAKYLRKLVPQAEEKQAALKTAKADEPEEKEDEKSEEESAPAPEGADAGSEEDEKPAAPDEN